MRETLSYASRTGASRNSAAFILLFFCFSFGHLPTEVLVWNFNVYVLGEYGGRDLNSIDAFFFSLFIETVISIYASAIVAMFLGFAHAAGLTRTRWIDVVWMLVAGVLFSIMRWIPHYFGVRGDTTLTWALAGSLPFVFGSVIAFRPSRKAASFV